MKSMALGLDLAKEVFHFESSAGQRQKLKRSQLLRHFATRDKTHIVMEACGSAHYWSRELQRLGHTTTLLPPQHVKAYARGQKNDYNDARAILEAYQHGKVRSVATKSLAQQNQQALIRARKLLIGEQTRLANQTRGLLLEYGIALPKGIASVRNRLPELIASADHSMTPLLRELLDRQNQRLQQLREEQRWYDTQVKCQAKQDDDCGRLCEVPGFGPIVSFAFKSWLGTGHQFRRGRDASAALGLVPRQHTSGDKVRLAGITKSGDAYLRSLVVHGARAVATQSPRKSDPLSCWVQRLIETRGFNKAVVALANKLVRIAWVVVARQEAYRAQSAV